MTPLACDQDDWSKTRWLENTVLTHIASLCLTGMLAFLSPCTEMSGIMWAFHDDYTVCDLMSVCELMH